MPKRTPGNIHSGIPLKLALLLICLLALGVRIGLIWNSGVGSYTMWTLNSEAARNLVEGRGYVIDRQYVESITGLICEGNVMVDLEDVPPPEEEKFTPFYQLTPGTPALLAATYWVFGEYRYIYLRILQAIIDSLGCLVIFLLARELFNRRTGLIAAGIYAVFLPIAALATAVIHDALMPFLTLTSLYFFVMGVRRGALKFYVLSAVFVGISCYFQPTAIFLPLLYGAGLFIYSLRKSGFRAQLLNVAKVTAVMVVVLTAIVLPWIIRNYHVTGVLSPSMRIGMWAGLWEGIGEFPDNPIGAKLCDATAWAIAREELGYDVEFGSPAFDAVFKPKMLNLVKEHPGWYASALARRIPRTIFYVNALGIEERCPEGLSWAEWDSQRVTWADYLPAARDGSLIRLVIEHPYTTFYWALVASFGIVPVLLSLAGIWVRRKDWRSLVLVATVPIYFSAVHTLVFVSGAGKSLLPGSIAYIVFSAIALDYIYGRITDRRNR